MNLKYKILIFLGSCLLIGSLSFIIYKQIENSKRQIAIEETIILQKNLIDGITRSQSQYATRGDIELFAKEHAINLKAIEDDLNKLHATVTSINSISVSSAGQTHTNVPSTSTGEKNPTITPSTLCKDGTPCPNQDPYGYNKVQQIITLNEEFPNQRVPFGSIGFSGWKPSPFDVKIEPRTYHVNTVTGTDQEQRIYHYSTFTVDVNGISYKLPIATATERQEVPESKFTLWNPRAYITSGFSIEASLPIQASFNAGLVLSPMSYGRYLKTPDINFLELGLGYQARGQNLAVIFTPISFNIGKLFPAGLVDNTFIGPSMQVSIPNANTFFGINLSIGL